MSTKATGALAGLALLAGGGTFALLAGGGTFALWNDSATTQGGTITSGDLEVALTEPGTWSETSPEATGQPRTIDPADFLATPGDTLVLRQDFLTTLVGENIAGQMSVHWNQQNPEIPEDLTATYRLHDGDGGPVTDPVPVGEPVTLTQVPAGEASWKLTVEFVLDPDAAVAYSQGAGPATPTPLADLGDMVIDLRQVRSSPGASS